MLIEYCPVCSYPKEYCEFGPTPLRCSQQSQPIGSSGSQELSESQHVEDSSLPYDLEKQSKKEARQMDKERKRLENLRVHIKTMKKVGNKMATHISGTSAFGMICLTYIAGIDSKQLSKALSNRFACGCSVTKNSTGEEELIIQGDVVSKCVAFLTTNAEWKDLISLSQFEIKK